MRYIILIALWSIATVSSHAQNKAEITDSFLRDMKLVNSKRESTNRDSLVVVKFYKPDKNKKNYKFDLYRVEEFYRSTEAAENIIDRKIMAATHLLVTLNPGVAASSISSIFPSSKIGLPSRIPNTDTFIVPVKNEEGSDVQKELESFSRSTGVQKTQFDAAVKSISYDYVLFIDLIPNDPDFARLWALNNTGMNGGTVDADIDAVEAWNNTTGHPDLVIGVIDTGIDYKHPELSTNMWENVAEKNGVKNKDDDNNGYVDDFCGWNFYDDNNDPNDDNMHGTHVAGTIGALANNKKGIAGVAPKVKLVALKFLNAQGSGYLSDALEAINYATRIPKLIATNNSWGGGGFSQEMKDAIDDASRHDILFVAAAGNSGRNNDVTPAYPASYDCGNIISVAATDFKDQLASFSNYGRNTVHIGAPGVGIYSTTPKKKYDTLNGTSMAAPHVSGVCVLVRAMFPALTMMQVRGKILTTGDPKPSLSAKTSSGSRLNANGSISATVALE
jgi:large repetitive protein